MVFRKYSWREKEVKWGNNGELLCVRGSLNVCFRWSAMSIHGDKTQQERDHVLQGTY